MGRALVWLRLQSGSLVALGHGDFIGRVWTAALILDDPRVSEGHAMVSLRGGELWILALRRRVAVDGRSVGEARLEAGQTIELADRLSFLVERVELPDRVLAVEAEGLPAVALPAVASLRGRPRPSVIGRHDPEAPCLIWTTGEGWRRMSDGLTVAVEVGDAWEVEGLRFRAVWLALSGGGATRITGGVDPPLRITVSFDTAQVQRGGDPPVLLSGQPARVLSELVAFGGPAAWEVVAAEIWPDETEDHLLRKKWDVVLGRLRARLREGRVRPDLVRAAGTGQVELLLRPGDVVEDKT
jgi:hypothetical protein